METGSATAAAVSSLVQQLAAINQLLTNQQVVRVDQITSLLNEKVRLDIDKKLDYEYTAGMRMGLIVADCFRVGVAL